MIGVNAWFATSLLAWLDQHGSEPPGLPDEPHLLLTAAGRHVVSLATADPGYYDLTADVALALVALMFLALLRGPQPPWWIPLRQAS